MSFEGGIARILRLRLAEVKSNRLSTNQAVESRRFISSSAKTKTLRIYENDTRL